MEEICITEGGAVQREDLLLLIFIRFILVSNAAILKRPAFVGYPIKRGKNITVLSSTKRNFSRDAIPPPLQSTKHSRLRGLRIVCKVKE